MGGHDVELPKVPDWRIYRVEDVPELMKIQKNLAQRGLRYPWLRNEVWKYGKDPVEKSIFKSLKFLFCGGFKYGVAAGIVTIIAEQAFLAYTDTSEEGGGHH